MGKKLSIVGGGKMGEALLSGLLAAEWAPADEISVVEPDDSRRDELQKKYKETPFSGNLVPSDNYLLAVKPQLVPNICQELSNSDPLRVMSIAAGVTIASIESQLTTQTAVLRVMPNTPAMVREGMSAIAPGSFATSEDLDWASSILSAVGEVVIVDESTLDAVTGLSGSGPAYLFFLAEAMTQAGINNGLDPTVADILTRQTLLGASTLLAKSGTSPEELRASVTSPNGTTAAAISELQSNDFLSLINKAISAATDRSKELGA
ncbi:MAG: pyrroline-5-carboxylate reductase [Acidimicrobiaceae bacterium TMED130]|nr:MAG: pyrroline-5-carboxylate reductase [Acidimicrobiaceae bacterium TMED130]|tara:strand:+ start:2294 stop:3085 length:792 start_codon:yes stop_codon:yes gene_type:complete